MFSGIVEEAGEVVRITEQPASIRLAVRSALCAEGAKVGDSIAVNGCCLTVVAVPDAGPGVLEFDLLRETWTRTNFRFAQPGSLVNLERSLPVNGRLHGHFVSGHIDGTGPIEVFEKRGADWFLRVKLAPELLPYTAFKGSIALDGISLTLAETGASDVAVWVIPHTFSFTALKVRKPGDLLNVETDILAKYVSSLLSHG